MRVFIAACEHETNSFSPLATDMGSFQAGICLRPGEVRPAERRARFGDVVGYGAFLAKAEAAGWEVTYGPAYFAQPSAPAPDAVWRALRDSILNDLRAAGRVDVVLLALHGAQMSQTNQDCEGDLLADVRAIVGPDAMVGVLLDLHGHVSRRMLASADVLVACLEYPHTDFDARADLLFDIVAAAATGGPRPFTLMSPAPMLDMHHTTRAPMDALVAAARQPPEPALALSLMHGFPWADCEDAGASVLVVADRDTHAAQQIAEQFAGRFLALRGEVAGRHLSLDAALALVEPGRGSPLVIADAADNPGGGAASDSTYFLRALIDRGLRAGVAVIWDPETVDQARAAGEGAEIQVAIGGKAGPLSGAPVTGLARVLSVSDDLLQGGPLERAGGPSGGALLEIGGVVVALSGRRQQCVSPEAFTCFGFDPCALHVIVVKSMQHFHAGFAPIAREIIYAAAPGSLTFDLPSLPFARAPRPIWPLDPISP